jgi:phage terminase small subunit
MLTNPALPLRNAKHEAFVAALVAGKTVSEAYGQAGYQSRSPKTFDSAARKLKAKVWPRVQYLLQKRVSNIETASERVVERLALRKEKVARELLKSAIGSMGDYTRLSADGRSLVFDFSKCTPDQMAAIHELSVEEFMDGRGEDAVPVRRTRIKLYNRNAALMNVARMFGWVIERQEDTKSLEARLRQMTPEQRRQHADDLAAQIQRRLAEHEAQQQAKIEASDAVYED